MTSSRLVKKILDKTGLSFMALGILTAIIYSLVVCYIISSVPRFNIVLFCEVVLPAVFVAGMTLLNRLFGGILATIMSVVAFIGCVYSRFSTIDTKADTAWFIITICFLLGGVLILSSLGIRLPKKIKAKA